MSGKLPLTGQLELAMNDEPASPRVVGSTIRNQFGEWRLKTPIVRTTAYPSDDELVALMAERRRLGAVAAACEVEPSTLRNYLVRRPELNARVRAHMQPKLTAAERRERNRRCSRDYMRRKRLANPEAERARRRLSMAGNKPPGDKPAIDPEMNDYARVLRADPCAYCGAKCTHIDHIEPIAAGGAPTWDNLTSACTSCNCRKRTKPLLAFLVGRG